MDRAFLEKVQVPSGSQLLKKIVQNALKRMF